MDPYIVLETSVKIGSELSRLLREDSIAPQSQLFYYWEVVPYFNGDYQIRFRLSSPQLSSAFIWRTKRLWHDFQSLASMIQKLASQLRQHDHPPI